MSFGATSTWLIAATLRNVVILQWRRLRKPRYLVPTALAVLYFGWVLRANTFGFAHLKELFPGAPGLGAHAETLGTFMVTAGRSAPARWTTAGQGPLALGRTMLASLVQFIGFAILALPAILSTLMLVAVGRARLGCTVFPVAGLGSALILVVEIGVALLLVGRVFEKLDPSDL